MVGIDVRLKERGIALLTFQPLVAAKRSCNFTIEPGYAATRECGGVVPGRLRPWISCPARALPPR